METPSWDLKPLHCELLKLFKEFVLVCERHDLRYFAMAGTALGAVRHGGFIPWDDDFDVMMPREDYIKLSKVANEEFKTGIRYSRGGECDLSPVDFARIWSVEENVVQRLSEATNLQLKHPPFIDIFVLDGVPLYVNQFKQWRRCRNLWRLCQIYRYPYTATAKTLMGKIKCLVCRMLGWCISWKYPSTKDNAEMVALMDEIALRNSYDGSFMVVEPMFFNFRTRRLMPKCVLEPAREVKFETVSIKVPARVEEYLTRIYGDYMTLPPKAQQLPDHTLGFSAGVPEWSRVE